MTGQRLSTRLLNALSGLPLTLAGLFALGAGSLLVAQNEYTATQALAPGYLLLLLNLLMALFYRASIRRSNSLLIFHIGLLLLMLLSAHSRMTYFKGWVELLPGERFTVPSGELSKGPWFSEDYSSVHFQQAEFFAYFNPDRSRERTDSYITTDNGRTLKTLSDQTSLIQGGYNFTVSSEVGFSAKFTWLSDQGHLTSGYVNFPSQISFKDTQYNQFQVPGIEHPIQLKLVIFSERASYFEPYFRVPEHFELVTYVGDYEDRLRTGDVLALEQGALRFDELQPWMGYDVFYDGNITLILLTSLLTVLALAVFFYEKLTAESWKQPDSRAVVQVNEETVTIIETQS